MAINQWCRGKHFVDAGGVIRRRLCAQHLRQCREAHTEDAENVSAHEAVRHLDLAPDVRVARALLVVTTGFEAVALSFADSTRLEKVRGRSTE